MSHSEEPWCVTEVDRIVSTDGSNDGYFVADCFGPDAKANARRIVACVNTCKDLDVGTMEECWPNGGLLPCVEIHEKAESADTYRELCVELQATVAKLHSQILDNTVEKVCCGQPIQDNGYVCCGDKESDWPDWALEAMRTADEVNAKAEQLLGVKKVMSDPAFPNGPDITGGQFAPHGGMTQRQYYKAKALAGLMANPSADLTECASEEMAGFIGKVADLMLAEDTQHEAK